MKTNQSIWDERKSEQFIGVADTVKFVFISTH